jgi:hypothetical protein
MSSFSTDNFFSGWSIRSVARCEWSHHARPLGLRTFCPPGLARQCSRGVEVEWHCSAPPQLTNASGRLGPPQVLRCKVRLPREIASLAMPIVGSFAMRKERRHEWIAGRPDVINRRLPRDFCATRRHPWPHCPNVHTGTNWAA